ncbi:MAG TPA: helix-turn-helix domain-containing protein [Acidiphilium sp.]|nr:helix-turn-helix domain-containing protein [Acidiphilium sp.]
MINTEREVRDVGAVVHAVRILRYLAASATPHGVATIARETAISPSSCFAILRTLTRLRFVAFDTIAKTYVLGLGVAEIAAGFAGFGLAEAIHPDLDRLARKHGVPLVLWRVTGDGHLVATARAHGGAVVRVDVPPGLRLPALLGAAGRCVAAALDLEPDELARRFAGLRWQSPPDFAQYCREVALARSRGWAIDAGNAYAGLHVVGAAIVDRAGRPRLAMSGIAIAGQHEPAALERLGDELGRVAATIGAALVPPAGLPVASAGETG